MNYLFTKTALVFFVQNLWRDEAFSYLMSKQSVLEILRTTAQDFNPPLYYILLHFWMMIFGSSEVALRSVSFIFYVGTVFVLYKILTGVFKIPTFRALVYLLLIVINPFLLSYAFEARMYMMVTFFVTLSYYALWTSQNKLYRVAIITALYTHYFSVFVFVAQSLQAISPLIVRVITKKSFVKKIMRMKLKIDVFSFLKKQLNMVLPIVLFTPWVLYLLLKHNFSDGGFWIIKPLLNDILYLPFVLYTGYERVFGEYYHGRVGYTAFHSHLNLIIWILILIPIGLSLMTLFSLKIRTLHFKLPTTNYQLPTILLWAFFTPVSIFVISLMTTPLYHPRYYIVAVPGLILLVISSCELFFLLFSRIVSKNNKALQILPYVATIILVAYLFKETQAFNKLNLKYHSKQTVSRMYDEIMSVKKPQDQMLLTRDIDYPLALYYTGLDKVGIFNKEYAEIPSYVGKVLIPEDVTTFEFPRFPAKAFIIYYNSYLIRSEL